MFAFALFDLDKQHGYLVRDRIGVKPLYFSLQGGVLSFASEIKALWPLPWIDKKVNDLAWYHYLTFMVTPAPFTIFDGIYKLPAGFYAEIDAHKRISFREWYSPLETLQLGETKEYASEAFCVQRIKDLLLESTKKRMIADVPVGAYLSGGLDSSLNVALMSQFSSKIKTFTVACSDDAETNELAWARQVSKQFGTEHHEIVISEKEAFDFYQRMVYMLDEPLADCVCIPFYYVSQLAHDSGMKVVQVGEGADELFFGYPLYAQYATLYQQIWKPSVSFIPAFARRGVEYLARPITTSRPLKAEILSNWANDRSLFWGGALAFGEGQKQPLRSFLAKRPVDRDYVVSQIYPGLRQAFDSHAIIDYHMSRLNAIAPSADIGKQMLYLELKQRLPELLLMRADKMSMAASIEAREPYLDHHLVEFMMHVPLHVRFKKNTTKYLLKRAAENFLPSSIIYRPKVGFAAPTFKWFEHGRYFPAYFDRLAQETGQFPVEAKNGVLQVIDSDMNKNSRHRAVQNWVLQQMWTFTQVCK